MSFARRVIVFGLALCSLVPRAPGVEAGKLRVLTSFLPVYCFTANVAGDLAEVENLLPGNVEPHDYQFSRKDLEKLARADVVVINGLGLEKWLEKAIQSSNSRVPKRVVELAAGLGPELITRSGPGSGMPQDHARVGHAAGESPPNPHIWLDPRLARHGVTNILLALQAADPAHAAGYAANATNYLARLDQLDAALDRELAPVRGSEMVTYHDAFAYFARRYGLKVAGVIEPVPDLAPSLRYLAALYRAVRTNSAVKVIFTEPPAPSRLARQVAGDLRLPLAELDTLETGSLFPATYERAMRHNADILTRYLTPDAQTTRR